MRIALMGPPGAGKGTQCSFLIQEFGLTQVSTGDLIREAIRDWTPLGEEASRYVSDGQLVPDGLVRSLAEERIADIGFADFILDGYPRTMPQAVGLDAFLRAYKARLGAVALLEVDDETVIERLSARRLDPATGEVYHLVFRPPPASIPRSSLVQRDDDHPHAIRNRLADYRQLIRPLADFYRERGKLVSVDASGPPEEVSNRLAGALQSHIWAVPL